MKNKVVSLSGRVEGAKIEFFYNKYICNRFSFDSGVILYSNIMPDESIMHCMTDEDVVILNFNIVNPKAFIDVRVVIDSRYLTEDCRKEVNVRTSLGLIGWIKRLFYIATGKAKTKVKIIDAT